MKYLLSDRFPPALNSGTEIYKQDEIPSSLQRPQLENGFRRPSMLVVRNGVPIPIFSRYRPRQNEIFYKLNDRRLVAMVDDVVEIDLTGQVEKIGKYYPYSIIATNGLIKTPGSHYPWIYYETRGGAVYICEDRDVPNALTRIVRSVDRRSVEPKKRDPV